VKVSPEQLEQILRKHGLLIPHAIRQGMLTAAFRGQAYLTKKSPVDRGELKNAWDVRKTDDGALLMNDAPHAGIVEAGARPHEVNAEGVEAIYQWVKRKGLLGPAPQRVRGGRYSTAGEYGEAMAERDQQTWEVVWAIIHKLKKEGQKPTWFVRDSLDTLRIFAMDEVCHQLEKSLRDAEVGATEFSATTANIPVLGPSKS